MKTSERMSVICFALIVASLWLGAAAWAADAPGNLKTDAKAVKEPAVMGPRWIQALDLTQEQVAKLRQDRLQTRREMIKTQADMRNLQLDLQEALLQDKPDPDQIEKIANRLGETHARMVLNRAKSVIFLRSVLTPVQKQKLDALLLQLGEPGMHGGGMHRERPDWEEGGAGPEEPR